MPKYYKLNNSTIMYLNSSYNCVKSSSITLTLTSAGSGYTAVPTISITTATGDGGSGATATCSVTSGIISSLTTTNNGSGYSKLPIVTIVGGGSPGVVIACGVSNGGTGYALPPLISLSGGGGTGFAGYSTLTSTTVSSTFTITNGGTGYVTGDALVFDFTNTGGGAGTIATVVATAGVITGITLTAGGTGFTRAPPIITGITSTAGTGAVITANLVATSVSNIVVTNGGSNYTTTPTVVFTPVSGGSGAIGTVTLNPGTSAIITPTFNKTYSFTWNIPTIEINDLARLSVLNIISTSFTSTTPYTFRILGLQYNSRNCYFSDYGAPILSITQQQNTCAMGSIGYFPYGLILTPQTLGSISLSVDDDIATTNSGISSSINIIIALQIEEYDPNYTEIGDVYGESASRLKLNY